MRRRHAAPCFPLTAAAAQPQLPVLLFLAFAGFPGNSLFLGTVPKRYLHCIIITPPTFGNCSSSQNLSCKYFTTD